MEEVFGRRTKQPRCYVAARPRGPSECGWGVLVCRPAGILTGLNGLGEADRESRRCGKVWKSCCARRSRNNQDSAWKSNQWGKQSVRRGGATTKDVQTATAAGLLSVRLGLLVRSQERSGCLCVVRITEFIASGCLGNVSGFKKYLNKCAEDGHWFS